MTTDETISLSLSPPWPSRRELGFVRYPDPPLRSRAFLHKGFLTDAECEHLISLVSVHCGIPLDLAAFGEPFG